MKEKKLFAIADDVLRIPFPLLVLAGLSPLYCAEARMLLVVGTNWTTNCGCEYEDSKQMPRGLPTNVGNQTDRSDLGRANPFHSIPFHSIHSCRLMYTFLCKKMFKYDKD
ncbi:hypothetical protein BLOT_011255 [Blomia tropicalis]|nr:hypothetical protein BLOT_011255 [Blomia tropicalis]